MSEIAQIILACATLLSVLGTFIMQVLTLRGGAKRDGKLNEVHELVNGQSEMLRAAVGRAEFAKGHTQGLAEGVVATRLAPPPT